MKMSTCLVLLAAMMVCQNFAVAEEATISDPKVIPIKTKPPEEEKIYPIAIIGAGAAGSMAVNRAVLNNTEVLLFAGAKQERRRSRGNWVRKVDNVPGLAKYNRTILELRNEVLEELAKSPLAHNLFLIEESIFSIEKSTDFFTLTDGTGHKYYAKYVVLATGIMDEQPVIQGSIRPIFAYANGQTMAYCVICDGHRCLGKKTVVIGHSENAGCIALFLSEKFDLPSMTILTNGRPHEFDPELTKDLQNRNISIFETPIQEILGNGDPKLLSGFKLESGDFIEAEMGYVALGVRPNNQLALLLGAEVDTDGFVITDNNGETSIPDLFVIGDLRANSMKQIYTAWQHAVDTLQLIYLRLWK
jgi:thioredoxin reductase (NADPH)